MSVTFKVCVAGKRRFGECHRARSLKSAKQHARIGATKGRRGRVVYRCTSPRKCRVVKRYKAGR
jgi:hypothetical protein